MCRAETSSSGLDRTVHVQDHVGDSLKRNCSSRVVLQANASQMHSLSQNLFPPVLYHPQMKIEKLVSVIHSSSCASLSIPQAKKSSVTSRREPHPFSADRRRQQQRTQPCRWQRAWSRAELSDLLRSIPPSPSPRRPNMNIKHWHETFNQRHMNSKRTKRGIDIECEGHHLPS